MMPESYLLIGGQHISMIPQSLSPTFNLAVLGEGEETLAELMRSYLRDSQLRPEVLETVAGLAFYRDGVLKLTSPRPLIESLDLLPFWNWSLLPDIDKYFRYYPIRVENRWVCQKRAYFFASRGCPFKCVYCVRPVFWKKLRENSPERFVEELTIIVKNFGVENIWLWDDMFILDPVRIEEIIKEMEKRKILGKVTFSGVSLRTDIFSEKLCQLIKKMGVVDVMVGYESGDEKLLREVKKSYLSLPVEASKKASILLKKYKINIIACFIYGLPLETREAMEASTKLVAWLRKMGNLKHLAIATATPFPGTQLWTEALKRKTVSEKMDWRKLRSHYNHKPNYYRHTTVFFKDKVTDAEFERVWAKVAKIWRKADRDLEKLEGWPETNFLVKINNLVESRRFAIRRRIKNLQEFSWRDKFLRILTFISHPKKIVLVIKDLYELYQGEKRLKMGFTSKSAELRQMADSGGAM